MENKQKKKLINFIEAIIWVTIIAVTIITVLEFDWNVAQDILQYILIAGTIASIYFYLYSRSLYKKSQMQNDELRLKQKQIKEYHTITDLVINNSADGFLILNNSQQIEEFSPGMEKISGFNKSEAIGRDAKQFLKFRSEKGVSLLPDLMFTANSIDRNPYVRNYIENKDGKDITIEASYALTKGTKGKTKALAIIRDITYEEDLVQRDKEFIAVTSHQLNTPLSIIRGYSSLLLQGKIGKISLKQRDSLNEIHSSVEKMITLTNNMLSVSRIEQEKIKLNIEDVNIGELINTVVGIFEIKTKEKKIYLEVSEIKNNLIIMADPDKLTQVISNLIDNAIKYTKKGGVKISLVDKANKISISVVDTGVGISKEDIEKVGTRFFRSQQAIDIDNHGTGLGLYISKTIIEKHNGELNINSKLGAGTTVTVTLPKRQEVTNG